VIVVEQLAAKLKVELAAKLSYALSDVLRLKTEILLIVKSYFLHLSTPFPSKS